MAAALKNRTNGGKGIISSFGGFNTKSRKVISSTSISKRDKEGVIRLYEALVPRKEVGKIQEKIVKQYFPTFDDIDVDMIVQEGFPKFEQTIGTENFAKVKKYFGIGCKATKNQNSKEIENLLAEMRTIENAQNYISGYKELISRISNLLEGADEYSDIEKTKLIRMYFVLFLCYIYFVEDLGYESKINYIQLMNNNKSGLYPEELFVLYVSRLSEIPEKDIFFDSIIFEFNQIKDKKILKEILEFAELDYKEGKFASVNKSNPYQNFARVRAIKQKIHVEPSVSPIELFGVMKFAKQIDFANLYEVYKTISCFELDKFKLFEKEFERFEGSRIVQDKCFWYEISHEQYISGEYEKNRIINLFKILAKKDLEMVLGTNLETGEELDDSLKVFYNVRSFLAAIKFAKDANIITETSFVRDFEIADELIKRDKSKCLSRYFLGEITISEVKTELKIDETFEFEFFGIKPKIDHKDVLVNFAIQNGYAKRKEAISIELIENILIPGNEELIEKFSYGEIGIKKFEKELGFNSKFAEMFFDISKIDISLIETELLEAKRSSVGKKKLNQNLRLIVLLYCYAVDGQINCGPKNRIPKRNKALKTSILKTLV